MNEINLIIIIIILLNLSIDINDRIESEYQTFFSTIGDGRARTTNLSKTSLYKLRYPRFDKEILNLKHQKGFFFFFSLKHVPFFSSFNHVYKLEIKPQDQY